MESSIAELSEVRRAKNDLAAQNYELLKILIHKDSVIKRLEENEIHIKLQLDSATKKKHEFEIRWKAMNEREMLLQCKEKVLETERDCHNAKIRYAKDDVRISLQQHVSTTEKLRNEYLRKSEQLRKADSEILNLTQNNRSLKAQLEDNVMKLQQQKDESAKIVASYTKELEAKTKLAELLKANAEDRKSLMNELEVVNKRIKTDNDDQRRMVASQLQSSEAEFRLTLKQKDSEIDKLKQDLELSKCSLKRDYNYVFKKLELKERDYNQLEIEMKNMIEECAAKKTEFFKLQFHCGRIEELNRTLSSEIAEKAFVIHQLENVLMEVEHSAIDKNAVKMLTSLVFNLKRKNEKVEMEKNKVEQFFRNICKEKTIDNVGQTKRKSLAENNGPKESLLSKLGKRPCHDARSQAIEMKVFGSADSVPDVNDEEVETCLVSVKDASSEKSSFSESQTQRPPTDIGSRSNCSIEEIEIKDVHQDVSDNKNRNTNNTNNMTDTQSDNASETNQTSPGSIIVIDTDDTIIAIH